MTASDARRAGAAWTRADWLTAAALFAGAVLSRIPFRTGLFYAWDSILYTRALGDFDVTIDQPHPPGHIFYVGLIKLADALIGDPNAAMVWVSILAGAAAVVALYALGRRMFGRPVGLAAALLLATSLSFWAYSEVAYPYTLLAFLSIFIAALIYRAREGESRFVLPAALALGLASGFRQDLLAFMLPLFILGFYREPLARRLGSVALMAAGVAAWYVPSFVYSGGFDAYRQASSDQTAYVLESSSVFGRGLEALALNLHDFTRFTVYGATAATPLVLYFIVRLALPGARPLLKDRRLLFLAVWALPSTLFYILIHVGEYGYVFSFLPALLLMAAWGAQIFARTLSASRAGVVFGALVAAAVSVNLLFFLVLSPPLSAQRLAAREEILSSRLEAVRNGFDPASTLIVSVYDYQHADWYLPEFQHLGFDAMASDSAELPIPAGIRQVVIFEDYLNLAGAAAQAELPLAHNQKLRYFEREHEDAVVVDWGRKSVTLADR